MKWQEWPHLVSASVQRQSEEYEAAAEQLKGNVTEWVQAVRQTAPSKATCCRRLRSSQA